MLTKKQVEWLNHLSDSNKVKIIPYDPKVKKVFQKQQKEIQSLLGPKTLVLHKGASAWGISGKGDLDIYIPTTAEQFARYFEQLKEILDEPGSYYPLERVRWNKQVDGIETEIFLVNKDVPFWKDSLIFWEYIESHPETLEEYRKLKEAAEGMSTREYYRVKIEFYNKTLESARNN